MFHKERIKLEVHNRLEEQKDENCQTPLNAGENCPKTTHLELLERKGNMNLEQCVGLSLREDFHYLEAKLNDYAIVEEEIEGILTKARDLKNSLNQKANALDLYNTSRAFALISVSSMGALLIHLNNAGIGSIAILRFY